MEPSPSLPPGVAFSDGARGTCPTCQTAGRGLYSVAAVPTTSNVLFHTQAEARAVPMGTLDLATCDTCGLLWNAAFDDRLVDYSKGYEETQGFSPTFRKWLEATTQQLSNERDLRGKLVVEVGCGKGEFLASLCAESGGPGNRYRPFLDSRSCGFRLRRRLAVHPTASGRCAPAGRRRTSGLPPHPRTYRADWPVPPSHGARMLGEYSAPDRGPRPHASAGRRCFLGPLSRARNLLHPWLTRPLDSQHGSADPNAAPGLF